jgi:hypothetical protein
MWGEEGDDRRERERDARASVIIMPRMVNCWMPHVVQYAPTERVAWSRKTELTKTTTKNLRAQLSNHKQKNAKTRLSYR